MLHGLARATITVVKAAARLIVRYILILVALILILALGRALIVFGTAYDPLFPLRAEDIGSLVFDSLSTSVPTAVLLALTLSLFALLRTSGRKAGALLTLACCAVLIGGALIWLSVRLDPAGRLPAPSGAPPREAVVAFPETHIYIADRENPTLFGPVAAYELSAPPGEPGFRLHAEALLDPNDGSIVLPETGRVPAVATANNTVQRHLRGEGLVASILSAARSLRAALAPLAGFSPPALALFAASILWATGLWFFARLTRWPFLNLFLTLGAFRGLLYLVEMLRSSAFESFAAAFVPEAWLLYVPALAIGGVGLILMLLIVVGGLGEPQ